MSDQQLTVREAEHLLSIAERRLSALSPRYRLGEISMDEYMSAREAREAAMTAYDAARAADPSVVNEHTPGEES